MDSKSDELHRLQAEVIQAAGHPIRLAIMHCFADGEQCVCDIAEQVGAVVFSIAIGPIMHLIYHKEQQAKAGGQAAVREPEVRRPLAHKVAGKVPDAASLKPLLA